MPTDRNAPYVFFQLIASRYEKHSTIFTTNQPFSKWGEVFGDNVIASAIVDRIIYHCEIIKITGQPYRIKGKIDFTKEKKFIVILRLAKIYIFKLTFTRIAYGYRDEDYFFRLIKYQSSLPIQKNP